MRSSTGRWVSGDDFFDRKPELTVLAAKVGERNHLLLSGQRRMGKTSILQELGRQLEHKGWLFFFVDVEGALCAEDAVAGMAKAVHPVRSIASRFAASMKEFVTANVEEIGAGDFSVKIRGGLDGGNWQRHGERLLAECSAQGKPVLLVIDELPIFLKRMHRQDGNAERVDEFLSWLRGAVQVLGDASPVLILSGSIGLEPLVRRLGLSDRINHFFSLRLDPWSREAGIDCFNRLAASNGLRIESGVAATVCDALGIGIPHHIQCFFARLSDFAKMHGRESVGVEDVREVYRTAMLGPSGQNDLVHYETRLKEALDEESHSIAMEILAEAATVGAFGQGARNCLAAGYSKLLGNTTERIADALDVLVHDGYLEQTDGGYRFASLLLRDWWAARFRDHHVPLKVRFAICEAEGPVE